MSASPRSVAELHDGHTVCRVSAEHRSADIAAEPHQRLRLPPQQSLVLSSSLTRHLAGHLTIARVPAVSLTSIPVSAASAASATPAAAESASHASPSSSPSSPSFNLQSSSSSSPSSSSPSPSPSSFFPASVSAVSPDHDWNAFLPHIYAGARKGAKPYQEDAFFSFISPSGLSYVGGVFDGHGGYNGTVASCTARDYASAYFHHNAASMDGWSVERWREQLPLLFERMHEAIRRRFVEETETVGMGSSIASAMAGGRRYVDDKGIVRSANGDPVHGGSTATIIIMVRDRASPSTATIITANVGDSTALLLPHGGEQHSFLSVDHGPENPDEFHRIATLPQHLHPLKLLFVYDKTNQMRKYDCPLVFLPHPPVAAQQQQQQQQHCSPCAERDPVYVSNPWGHGLHPTNVRYEPAVYAVTPKQVVKDSTCIAMTRALGDFYAHQFGLTWMPSIGVRRCRVTKSEEKAAGGAAAAAGGDEKSTADGKDGISLHESGDGFTIILASDGIWDCWKYEDFHAYLHSLLYTQRMSVGAMGETALEESMDRAIANFGNKHYDDACIITWVLK